MEIVCQKDKEYDFPKKSPIDLIARTLSWLKRRIRHLSLSFQMMQFTFYQNDIVTKKIIRNASIHYSQWNNPISSHSSQMYTTCCLSQTMIYQLSWLSTLHPFDNLVKLNWNYSVRLTFNKAEETEIYIIYCLYDLGNFQY